MSLHVPADGLLQTHVTWNDVEMDLQRVLGTKAKFGANREIKDIGDMKGFMSKVAMIQADWEVPSDETARKLPDRVAVKMSSELALYNFSTLVGKDEWDEEKIMSMTELVKKFHNREVDIYRIIEREKPNCPTVNVLALEEFTKLSPLKAYIISEFIPNLHHIGMHETIPLDDIWGVVDGTAAFSAMGESMSEEEKQKSTGGQIYIEEAVKYFFDDQLSTGICSIRCNTENITDTMTPLLTTKLRSIISPYKIYYFSSKSSQIFQSPDDMRKNLVSLLGVAFEDKVEEAMDIFDLYCGSPIIQKNYSRVSEFLGHKPVLMHSDIWPYNLLFSRNSENKLEFKALIDFQTASLSSPGLDVACLMVTCLSKTDRRSSQSALLDRYYSSFCNSLKPHNSVPYTREQLEDSFNLCFPAAVILMLPFIISFSMKLGDNIPDESQDKIAGLIEDLVTVHKLNMEKFPRFFH